MLSGMKWLISGALLSALLTAPVASVQAASPLSSADLKKLLSYVDSIGVKQSFEAPMAKNLGLSNDEKKELPVVSVVTSDHKIYFCRSGLNAKDYVIWVIGADGKSSSIFVTHDDLKLTRALHMHADKIPALQNIHDDEVEVAYEKALAALAQDLKKNSP